MDSNKEQMPESITPPSPIQSDEVPNSAPGGDSPLPRPKHTGLIIAVVILVLLIIVGGTIAYILMPAKNDPTVSQEQKPELEMDTANLDDLPKVTLVAPNPISPEFTPRDLGTPTIQDFTTKNNCELQFGTLSVDKLPGANLEEILNRQIEKYRQSGATVKGPKDGEALFLKDAANKEKAYRVPTFSFELSQKDRNATSHYSAAVLKDGTRAYVLRVCNSQEGPVNPDALKPVDDAAKQIMVKTE